MIWTTVLLCFRCSSLHMDNTVFFNWRVDFLIKQLECGCYLCFYLACVLFPVYAVGFVLVSCCLVSCLSFGCIACLYGPLVLQCFSKESYHLKKIKRERERVHSFLKCRIGWFKIHQYSCPYYAFLYSLIMENVLFG